MRVRLLDVNVLISLLDAAHVHHASALQWFRKVGRAGWATCALTENGFVRIVSHVSYPNLRLTAASATESLATFKAAFSGVYHFWPDDVSLTDPGLFDLPILTNSRQVTDAYLAGLSFRNRGRLATFNGNIAWKAVRGAGPDLIEKIAVL